MDVKCVDGTMAFTIEPAKAPDSAAPSSGRRGFLKVAIPSAIAGWWITGRVEKSSPDSLYDLSAVLGGEKIALEEYRGKVVLVVNVATNSALTPQYQELVALYDKFNAQGFDIIAFPCNQFGGQEPGRNKDIRKLARNRYGVEFQIFDKVNVNPPDVPSVYKFLKATNPDSKKPVEWNFTKFLVDRNGHAVARFEPGILPSMLDKEISLLLAEEALPPRDGGANPRTPEEVLARFKSFLEDPPTPSVPKLPSNISLPGLPSLPDGLDVEAIQKKAKDVLDELPKPTVPSIDLETTSKQINDGMQKVLSNFDNP
ncbi:hypothetical protein NDN08_007070 [Rhodosorus marinus]|uniref:Glutathione peroxidase n=1 Tax=Rhodosorus marinus TaxID=101924 RepID=A0AAV8UFH5_9RHOD|nr:hypothetical protein NDN08_007070 [Rhodosorus marinus]